MKKFYAYILGLSFLFMINVAYAQTSIDCTQAQDCTSLGYTKTVDNCNGIEAVKCPFDTSKVFCLELPPEPCKIGSILYSDKSCSVTVKSGKTPIGVVFDTNKRLAVALTQAGRYMMWSPTFKTGEDVTALSNCSSGTQLTCNPNGKDNTSKIVSQYGSSTSYAAGYCADYVTSGTSKGDWYLPSIGELKLLYKAKSFVNATLGLLGRSALLEEMIYWSSTEYYSNGAWSLYMRNGLDSGNFKDDYNYVRAVVAF